MAAAAFSLRLMRMMAVVFAAAARYFAVATFRIVGGRFLDVERFLGVFMRSAGAALADARWRLC
jgi:hypothetical protein